MSRTRVKICGITRVEDALAAAAAGADAIGLVFYPTAARNVSLDQARAILKVLPPFVSAVGLFVDAEPHAVMETVRALGLRHVQLHGDEQPHEVVELRDLRVVKALKVHRQTFGPELHRWAEAIRTHQLTNICGLVLETAASALPGGTGIANDWAAIHEAQEAGDFQGLPPIIAAGGLTPETVGAVIQRLRPYAVDVSTGVEETLGHKSVRRIAAFMAAVQDADELR